MPVGHSGFSLYFANGEGIIPVSWTGIEATSQHKLILPTLWRLINLEETGPEPVGFWPKFEIRVEF